MTRADALAPKQIFAAYAEGTMGRSEMIERIAHYPFAQEPATDGYDWLTPAAEGPTWTEVMAARVGGVITRDDYAAIRALRNSEV